MNKCLYCGKPVKNKYCNVSCQNKIQNTKKADKKYGKIKEFKVNCFLCKQMFIIKEREKLYPKKEKYYCSGSCANTRNINKDTKEKISKTLQETKNKLNEKLQKPKILITKTCEYCRDTFNTFNNKQRFCSRRCAAINNLCKDKDILRQAGLKSAQIQKEVRRSKNEKYFAELCKKRFDKVKTNEAIFNGWDADIILEDEKIAILWNGKWHYEKITKSHSVKQVQNRDRIKIKEIKRAGYTPYIIKDMGKYNKQFVENEFKKFKQYIAL